MANKTSKKSTKVAKPALLAGGNPQVAKQMLGVLPGEGLGATSPVSRLRLA